MFGRSSGLPGYPSPRAGRGFSERRALIARVAPLNAVTDQATGEDASLRMQIDAFHLATFGLFHALSGSAAIKYAGATYLLWLASKMCTAPAKGDDADVVAPKAEGVRLFGTGLALSFNTSKLMILYIALVPALIDLTAFTTLDFIFFELVLVAVFISVLSGCVVLASEACRFVRGSRAVRRVDRATGTVMTGAAILVATR